MQYPIRLNKYISHASRFSRREADKLIESGRISINKTPIQSLATQVQKDDIVAIDGKPLKAPDHFFTVIVYNKPKGEIVSKKDDRGRKVVFDSLPSRFKHYLPVGRLDFASEGLLLLTDSPEVVHALTTSQLERLYKIKIDGSVTPAMEQAMKEGLQLEDATAGGHEQSRIESMDFAPFANYQIIASAPKRSKLKVTLVEGKNREIRRFFGSFERKVLDLKRLSFGGIELSALPTGKFRYLERKEYESLRGFLKELRTAPAN